MSDTDTAAAMFPSMSDERSSTPAPDTAPPADNAAPKGEEAIHRAAFPSMFKEATPPPSDERSSTPPRSDTPPATATSAPPATSAPSGEPQPVVLETAGIEISLPAGFVPDVGALEELDGLAGDLHLDAAGTQKLVDLHAQSMERAVTRAETEILAAWDAQQTRWKESAAADKEIGGAALKANVALARQVLDRFGSGFKAAIKDLGIQHHPELIRLLVRVGKALPGPAQKQSNPEEADRFFPSMK